MTLNLSQIQTQVKGQTVTRTSGLRSFVDINLAYRELKRHGWTNDGLKHPVDNVPVFQLRQLDAWLWRDITLEDDFVVQIDGTIYGISGGIADITARIEQELNVRQPKLTTVEYDRSAREWRAQNAEELHVFPAGPDGQRQAQLYALQYDAPDIADEVQAIIDSADALLGFDADGIAKRALKAGFIILDGKVWPGQADGEVARVEGTADEPCRIYHDGEALSCDCPDFEGERAPVTPNGQRGCKHVLAVEILAVLND